MNGIDPLHPVITIIENKAFIAPPVHLHSPSEFVSWSHESIMSRMLGTNRFVYLPKAKIALNSLKRDFLFIFLIVHVRFAP